MVPRLIPPYSPVVLSSPPGQVLSADSEGSRLDVEAFQRATLDALEQGVVLTDLQGTILLMNRTGERLLGMGPEALNERVRSGQWVTYDEGGEVMPPGRRPIQHTMVTGEPVHGAIVGWMRPDGHLRTFRISTEPLRDADGLTQVVTAFFDITDQRRGERRREIAEAALESERARFAALVERSSDLVCVIDAGGEVTYASPSSERLLGYPPGSNPSPSFTDLVHPEDLPALRAAFSDLLRSPGLVGSIEVRLLRQDGGWCHTEVVATNRLQDPDVRGIVANVRDITDRAEAAARLAWQAHHDPLTDLPNRLLLLDRLQQAIDRNRPRRDLLTLLFIDLDGFKDVNDTMGHQAGDQLLVEVARRLRAVIRPQDTVARLGGDEFVVVAEALGTVEGAEALAARLNRTLVEPFELTTGWVQVSCSIGVAFDVDHHPSTILRDADRALYLAKAQGKGRHEMCLGAGGGRTADHR